LTDGLILWMWCSSARWRASSRQSWTSGRGYSDVAKS